MIQHDFKNHYLSLVIPLKTKDYFWLLNYKPGLLWSVNNFLPSQNLHSSMEVRLYATIYLKKIMLNTMASGVKRTLFKWIKNDYKRGWSRQLCLSRWGLNIDTNVFMSRSVMSYSFATPWTIALQAALSLRFPRQAYWSGFPFPGDLPDLGIKPMSPALQADSLPLSHQGSPRCE